LLDESLRTWAGEESAGRTRSVDELFNRLEVVCISDTQAVRAVGADCLLAMRQARDVRGEEWAQAEGVFISVRTV
jgi:hypothetical protein